MRRCVRALRSQISRAMLLIVCSILMTSAVIRISSSAVLAMVEGSAEKTPNVSRPLESKNNRPAAHDREKMNEVIQMLNEREEKVKQLEQKVHLKEKILKETAKQIDRRINELTKAEEKLRGTIVQVQTASESDLQKLTTVYESMKPKDAAQIFQAMDANFAAGFFALMQPTTAASIMSELDSDLAYTISAVLAGRNARAAEY